MLNKIKKTFQMIQSYIWAALNFAQPCEYKNKCRFYTKKSCTCQHKGGAYCGKYRTFINNKKVVYN